jgi:catechol 2,3-dioxygenase-like lactoylglutathione lyase family enzyme
MPLQAKSFDHITLVVSDLDATRQFYINTLGLQEIPRPAFGFAGAWFTIGSVQIHATVNSPLAGKAGWGDRHVKRISRGHHFAFEISDVDEALTELAKCNIPIADGPQQRPDGVKQVYICDPDGHLVELFSFPDPGQPT